MRKTQRRRRIKEKHQRIWKHVCERRVKEARQLTPGKAIGLTVRINLICMELMKARYLREVRANPLRVKRQVKEAEAMVKRMPRA